MSEIKLVAQDMVAAARGPLDRGVITDAEWRALCASMDQYEAAREAAREVDDE